MKVVNVVVHIQMDVDSENPVLEQVQNTIDVMNKILGMSELETQPQIYNSDISNSDITIIYES